MESALPAAVGVSPRGVAAAAVVLFASSAALYTPSLSSDFVRLDDYQYVVDNPLVRAPGWSDVRRVFAEVRRPSTVDGYYQPLTMVSLMFDAVLAGGDGLDPFYYHLSSILLHGGVAVMVFLLLREMVGGVAVPLLLAACFAMHPAQVESVAWIAQRKTVLSTLLAVASLVAYLRSRRAGGGRPGEGRPPADGCGVARSGRGWLAAAVLLYLAGTLAKPTVVLLPLVLPLLDYWPLQRGDGERFLSVARWADKAPFLAVMLPMLWVSWVSQAESSAGLLAPSLSSWDTAVRMAALLCWNLVTYLLTVVAPVELSPYRDLPLIVTGQGPGVAAAGIGVVALVAAAAAGCLAARRRAPSLLVGGAAFLLLIAPALGAVRFVETCVADRFLYLPMIFLLAPAAAGLRAVEKRYGEHVRRLHLAVVAPLVPLAALTLSQQSVWRDSRSLWAHVVRTAPNLAKGHMQLAVEELENGDFAAAVRLARRAVELEPKNAGYLHVLGRALVRAGEGRRAVEVLRQSLALGLGSIEPLGHLSLAEALLTAGERAAARTEAETAIRLGRGVHSTYWMMGEAALRFARDYGEAVEYYRLALEADPDDLTTRWNLGTALQYAGRGEEALREYDGVIAECRRRGLPTDRLAAVAEALRGELVRRPG